MEVKWHQKELNVGSPVKISLPSVKVDVSKEDATKAVVAAAIGGISGAVAVGGVFALDEWKALNGQGLSTSAPVTPRSGTPSGARRVRVRHKARASPEARLAARNERRERERLLMQQMGVECNLMKTSGGAEPRGRYQAPHSSGMPRSASVPELFSGGLDPNSQASSPCPSPCSDGVPCSSPREDRIQRERRLMQQMAEMKRQEVAYSVHRSDDLCLSAASGEAPSIENMDLGAPALDQSFSFKELGQRALEHGVAPSDVKMALTKAELRELINQPQASPGSRLRAASLLPTERRRLSGAQPSPGQSPIEEALAWTREVNAAIDQQKHERGFIATRRRAASEQIHVVRRSSC